MNRTQGRTGRRNNAPVRPPRVREGSTIPDVLFCLSSGAFVLALILLVSTFTNDNVAAGHEGTQLAQLFSGALIAASVFLALVGILLLQGKRTRRDHYSTPVLLGVIAGAIEAVLVIEPAGWWIAAPLTVVFFALRPVRRLFGRMARPRTAR